MRIVVILLLILSMIASDLCILSLPLTPAAASTKHSWIEYEAEQQPNTGTSIGPSRVFGQLTAEASGRRAVLLQHDQQLIKFRLVAPANALTLRYALAAAPDGARLPSAALLEANNQALARVNLRSQYSFDDAAPPPHPPSHEPVHHFWDEVRVLLPHRLVAGTSLTVRIAPGSVNPFALDVVDAESVAPPARAPEGSISLLRFGTDPSGLRDSSGGFNQAVETARKLGRSLYVPAGHYHVDGHVLMDHVKIVGAGSWYSIVTGHNLGFYSLSSGSRLVSLSGFTIESDVGTRNDSSPLAAIGGTYSHSTFESLYLHHANVGIWLDGPARDVTIRNVDISDQAADGINLHRGIRDARIQNNFVRNTGDDGIALWSDEIPNDRIRVRSNRVTAPSLANGIAIYGGRDIQVSNNVIADVLVEGGGIHLGARFHSAPFAGTITIRNNRVVRAATMDPNWHFGVGAIWIYSLERPISAHISISDNQVIDPGCEAVQFMGPNEITGVKIDHLRIIGSESSPFAFQTMGSIVAKGVTTSGHSRSPIVELPAGLHLSLRGGNRGWSARSAPQVRPPQCTW